MIGLHRSTAYAAAGALTTLTSWIYSAELPAIAEQTTPLAAVGTGHPRVTLTASAVPVRAGAQPQAGLIQNIGSLGALLTLVAVPPLTVLLIKRRRA